MSHTVAIGTAGVVRGRPLPTPDQVEQIDADPVRTLDAAGSAAMVAEVEAAKKDGDTLGGVVEVVAYGLPPGLGLARALGPPARRPARGRADGHPGDQGGGGRRRLPHGRPPGSAAHDEMERDAAGVIHRRTGRAGGTEGGMSTGDVLRVRAAMKPISTVPRALDTVDTTGAEAAKAIHQRSDVCAVPAAGVVAEAMVALVLAQACVEKFGGDSVPRRRATTRHTSPRSPSRCARGDRCQPPLELW